MKNKTEKWEKVRRKGRARFILIQGILQWGLCTAVLWTIIMELFSEPGGRFDRLIVALVVFPLCGFFWGAIVWSLSEKRYQKRLESN